MFNFSISLLFFWIKGQATLENDQLISKLPTLRWQFFPSGGNESTVAVNDIANLKLRSIIQKIPLMISIILLIIGVIGIWQQMAIVGGIVIFIAILFAMTAFQTQLSFTHTGETTVMTATFYNKQQLVNLQNSIEEIKAAKIKKVQKDQFLEDL